MSNSRENILVNIRRGLQNAILPDSSPEKPELDYPVITGDLDLFAAELEKLSCEVYRTSTSRETNEKLIQLFRDRHWEKTLIWQSLLDRDALLKQSLENAAIEFVTTSTIDKLADIPVGITDCEVALADTGTIVQQNVIGQPAFVSLLPDVHIVLVKASAVYSNLQTYLQSIENAKEEVSASNNLVFITGPSRTGDIELTLTLGVHGPRELIVFIWDD